MTRHEVITKDSQKWHFDIKGSVSDGTEFGIDSYLEPRDEGRTVINTGRVITGGSDGNAFRDTYTKLSK